MELIEGIETRRSYRAFKSTPVPKETIEKVIKIAGRSPSFTNTQPWEVSVVIGDKKEELSKKLVELVKSSTPANPDLPLPEGWPSNLEARSREHSIKRFKVLGIERVDDQRRKELAMMNFKFYGAPCALFLFIDSTLGPWSIFDMGLFAQSISLAAHSLGIGSCMQATVARYPDAVRDCLGIPKTKKLVVGLSMGYPDHEAVINTYHTERAGLADFVQWHT
jgi:nitroreductase